MSTGAAAHPASCTVVHSLQQPDNPISGESMPRCLLVAVVVAVLCASCIGLQVAEQYVDGNTVSKEDSIAAVSALRAQFPDALEVVDESPTLVYGQRALLREIIYPASARRLRIQGEVTVNFVVDEQGNVRSPIVIKGIGGGCDQEVLRVIGSAKFNPGRHNGQAVKVLMVFSTTFRLRNFSRGLYRVRI